jgi:hypothetical protein
MPANSRFTNFEFRGQRPWVMSRYILNPKVAVLEESAFAPNGAASGRTAVRVRSRWDGSGGAGG